MLLVLQVLLFSFHVWTFTAESELTCSHQLIVGQTGDDVILPCSLHPPISASSEAVEWFRPDLHPRYIHVHRDGKQTSDQHSSYVNRTKLFVNELKNGNVSLKISAVNVSDAGTYKCFLPLMKKRATIELIIDLEVIGSDEPVIATVGDEVILPCHLEPPLDVTSLTVEWQHNGTIVHFYHSNEDDLTNQDENFIGRTSLFYEELVRGNISLTLTNVTEQDEGQYTCFVPELDSQVRRGFVTLVVGGDSWIDIYVIIAMVGGAVAALVLAVLFAVLVCKCRRRNSEDSTNDKEPGSTQLEDLNQEHSKEDLIGEGLFQFYPDTRDSTSSTSACPGSVSPHRFTSDTEAQRVRDRGPDQHDQREKKKVSHHTRERSTTSEKSTERGETSDDAGNSITDGQTRAVPDIESKLNETEDTVTM